MALGVLGSLWVVGGLPGVARADPRKLDSRFDGDGMVTTDFGDEIANALALQPDDKILVAGSRDDAGSQIALARYLAR